jgi:hypothetical protein
MFAGFYAVSADRSMAVTADEFASTPATWFPEQKIVVDDQERDR